MSDQQYEFLSVAEFNDRKLIVAQVILLMLDSPVYLADKLDHIKRNFTGALLHDQALVMFDQENNLKGYTSWALLSDQAEEKYKYNSNSLDPEEWNSGENLWLVDVIAPTGGAIAMLNFTRKLGYHLGYTGKKIKFKSYYNSTEFNIREVTL